MATAMTATYLTPPDSISNPERPITPPLSEAGLGPHGELVLVRKTDSGSTNTAQSHIEDDASSESLRSVLRLPGIPQRYRVHAEDEEPPTRNSRDVALALAQYAQRMAEAAITHNGRRLKAKATTALYPYQQLCYSSAYTKPAADILRETLGPETTAIIWAREIDARISGGRARERRMAVRAAGLHEPEWRERE
ncbi:hypothetical protein LTR91_008730 [Friedmanniomyces endolithicus]|uniref:Uncharacterized protein n=1 Tax=Friedmanniomyces endolithicus TaxID=329885 RepID=A0AAN6KMI0_9PEZI|nr:hypothetical protein LTR59_014353 [Friedmanniomyces endolithicus]KAK0780996.1 hypothetical protein LTR38_013902 [Friedmanniomyces endolithicus]KAK0803974.1 hypothetical protein LTR75_007765 [Friedmanniomyces endolithicus]KAK0849368.1 hypothetical protein LTR03_005245 [Friedmanniomyces endolithicus]KAK0862595.1 hypothetical protein LTS02_007104 [Friedmanniomyces endolithicus]